MGANDASTSASDDSIRPPRSTLILSMRCLDGFRIDFTFKGVQGLTSGCFSVTATSGLSLFSSSEDTFLLRPGITRVSAAPRFGPTFFCVALLFVVAFCWVILVLPRVEGAGAPRVAADLVLLLVSAAEAVDLVFAVAGFVVVLAVVVRVVRPFDSVAAVVFVAVVFFVVVVVDGPPRVECLLRVSRVVPRDGSSDMEK